MIVTSSLLLSPLKTDIHRNIFRVHRLHGMMAPIDKHDTKIKATFQSASFFTLLSAFAIAISYADRSNISTAIIPMAAQFNWDSFFSGIVLSAFWAGYAVTQVVGGTLADRYGGEKLLVLAIIAWSICTGLTPLAASLGSISIVLVRILLGAGEGLALPAIHSMTNKYIPSSYQSTTTAIITGACYAGALLSNLISPAIIETQGYEACFELFAIIPPFIWLPLWLLYINDREKAVAAEQEQSQIQLSLDSQSDIPLLSQPSLTDENVISSTNNTNASNTLSGILTIQQLLTYPAVWAIICAQYGQSWGMIGLLSWLPTYYNERFHVPISELSSFTVLPYLLQLIVAVVSGSIADFMINSGVRKLYVRQFFQIAGMLVPAVCLGYCAYTPSLTASQAYNVINVGTAASALTVAAVSSNHFDISPKNAGKIFGMGSSASCIGGLIAVPLSGYVYEQTHSWDAVFYIFVAHYILGSLLWGIWASDQPLIVVKDSNSDDNNDNNNSSSGSSNNKSRVNRTSSTTMTTTSEDNAMTTLLPYMNNNNNKNSNNNNNNNNRILNTQISENPMNRIF